MKLYISADIEGTAGIARWPETEPENRYYPYFADEMTQEVRCACEGATQSGADSIVVKDAHHTASNINPAALPLTAKIIRGWTRGPEEMMAGLDESFQAAAMVGYHSAGGTNGNPLAHTMNTQNEYVTINGAVASEFMISAYTAAYYRVPVVFVSGDKMLCESAKELVPGITAVPVSEGIGNAAVSLQPAAAQKAICEGMKNALRGDLSRCMLPLPQSFQVAIRFHQHDKAYYASYYPDAKSDGMKTVTFCCSDYYDVLRFFLFVL